MSLKLIPSLSFFGTWSYKFKLGILLGSSVVSFSAGTASAVINSTDIRSIINTAASPITQFINNNVLDRFNVVSAGAESIGEIYRGWVQDISGKSDSFLLWIKKQNFSSIISGFSIISSHIFSYFNKIKVLFESLSGYREKASQILELDFLKKSLVQVSEMSDFLSNTFALLSSSLFLMTQHSLTPSSVSNEESKKTDLVLQNLKKSFSFEFLKAGFDTVKDNFKVIKELPKDKLTYLFMNALNSGDKFTKRVQTLQTKNTSSKWGNYENGAALINDLFENSLMNFILKPVNSFFSWISSCEGEDCKEEDAFAESIIRLFEIFQEPEEEK